ncbi:hypothetical protein [Acinetobacter stercoris]|uniref:Fimbrial protein n=1 Tax=Acinetobacter stercoris TaxID=2126983 RepID=A0A2U3N345_9GAMM|nr:hypothetical protein [Acinetobacter stercoris]SPL72082.1 hypothetical protein KPC_3260 [Acinetobacter stercoris]
MIKSIKNVILAAGIFLLFLTEAYALTKPAVTNLAPAKNYIFVENRIDREYFIAPSTLDPRFSGANVWTKFGKDNQDNLGYMGGAYGLYYNYYVDFWLDDGSIRNPYQGTRCRLAAGGPCPAVGYMIPEYTDDTGSFKSKVGLGENGGQYAFGSFAAGAYEHFRSLSVGGTDVIDMNVCETNEEYNPQKGERCKDAKTGRWRIFRMTATKTGHIRLEDTKAFSEIWVASDGTPSLAENSTYCEYVIGATGIGDQKEGIACQMVKYDIDGNPGTFDNGLRFYMVVDNTALGFIPSDRDIQIEGGNGVWKRYNYTGTDNRINVMMNSGSGYVRVLFSKAFFKKLLRYGGSTADKDNIFTFAINNTVAPFSGFYQFATSMAVDIIPREYSISIKPSNPQLTHLEGKIGDYEPDIEFNYKIIQSAPRKADIVTAHIIGENVNVAGQKYCLFKSDDQAINVPIPAYLSYTNILGNRVEQYSGCDETQKMDITNALWGETPWDENNSGFFYQTYLKLRFPMNNPISKISMEGTDWLGTVHAEGDVKVEAKWIGVER